MPPLAASLPLLVLVAAAAPAAAQSPPDTFFVIHCEPQTAGNSSWLGLRTMVTEAEARNVKLSLEFGIPWAELILADPAKLATVRSWQQSGHAVGAHHHGVTHPYWDGYTDIPPWQVNRIEPWLGTMADFKTIVDPLVGPDGLQYGGIDDSEYEWPYGVPYQSSGGRTLPDAVSQPETQLRNRYLTWHISHVYLADPVMLPGLEALHDATSAPEVIGVVTHVWNYQGAPGLFEAWWDFLQAKDPTGAHNKTVMEILGGYPPPLQSDRDTLIAASGGQVQLELTTDASLAGESYQFYLSMSGSEPGIDWGGIYDDGVHIGLNPDSWTGFGMSHANSAILAGFVGTLGPAGDAHATVDTLGPLDPAFVGRTATFVVVAFGGGQVVFSSNPISIAIL